MSGASVETRADVLAPFGYGFAYRSLVVPPNPPAGEGFEHEVGAAIARPSSLIFTLALSAVLGERYLTVEYRRDGVAYAISAPPATFDPSDSARLVFSRAVSVATWNPGTDFFVPLDPSFLDPGDTLAIAVSNMDNGDTISGIRALFEEFPVGEEGYPTGRVEAERVSLSIPTDLDRLEAIAARNDLDTLPYRLNVANDRNVGGE